jgi:hypothetical protein
LPDMAIVTNQDLYKSGDSVEGELIITSDKEFRYNAIHLTFTGREHTRIVVSSGETSTVHTDERIYFSQTIEIAREGVMTVEGLRYPFQFMIPDEVRSSYDGIHGWIEYTLTGIIERSRARDIRKQITIFVRNNERMPLGELQRTSLEKDGCPIIDIEMEENAFSLGSTIGLRFRFSQQVKIRGVRVELIAKEEAYTKHHHRTYSKTLAKKFIERSMIEENLWFDVSLETNRNMPYSFNSEILSNETSIKVTLDVPWARDKSVFIPIELGEYSRASESELKRTFDFGYF